MIYRVTFNVGNEMHQVLCKKLDVDEHPFFVSMKELLFEDQSEIIISPQGDSARKRFGECARLRILSQHVHLIEELEAQVTKIRTFQVVNESNQNSQPPAKENS